MATGKGTPSFEQTTLRDIFFVLFRQKGKAITFFLVVAIAVFLATMLSPSVYRSEAKIMFRLGRESVVVDPTVAAAVDPIVSVGQSRDAEILSELEILASKELAEKNVDKFSPGAILQPDFDADKPVEEGWFGELAEKISEAKKALMEKLGAKMFSEEKAKREAAIEAFQDNFEIELNKKSNIVTIAYEAYSPDLATDILKHHMAIFLDKHVEVHQASQGLDFFREQRENLKAEVTRTEENLEAVRLEAQIGSFPEQQLILMNRLDVLQQQLEQVEAELAAAQATTDTLASTLNNLPDRIQLEVTSGLPNTSSNKMRERLFELKLREQNLLNKYQEDAVPVQTVRKEIAQAQAIAAGEQQTFSQDTAGVNAVSQQMEALLLTEQGKVSSLSAKRDTLRKQVATTTNELERIIQAGVNIVRLERDLKLAEQNYFKYADMTEQARINRVLEEEKVSNISVVQHPSVPIKPDSPRRMLNIALGVLLAFFGAIAFAFLAEYVDQTLKKPEEIEDMLGVPVLASIACSGSARKARRRLSSLQLSNEIVLRKGAQGWEIPTSVRSQFKTLRDNVCAAKRKNPDFRTVLVTSSHEGEGSTSVALNLGFVLTSGGNEKVLVIDTNTKSPYINEAFGVPVGPGIVDVLCEKGDSSSCVVSTPIENLDVLPAGKMREELAYLTETELFESDHFAELLSKWREQYDFILFDSPPTTLSPATVFLASVVDGVVWVIAAEDVRKPVIRYAKNLLEQSHATVLGAVFNKRQFYIPRWLYRRL